MRDRDGDGGGNQKMKTRTELISEELIKVAFSAAILIIAFIAGIQIKDSFAEGVGESVLASSALARTTISIVGEEINVRVAETPAEREKGLSGVSYLAQNSGMLFKFETPGLHGIWMKDMKIPLDIIWFDKNMRVVHIEERVEPNTYPYIYKPSTNSLYVLEVPTGFVEFSDVKIGSEFSFLK